MKENYIVCNCMQVSYNDIANAMQNNKRFDDAMDAFNGVQEATKCSTGCGGCYEKVLDIVSDIMSGSAV